MHSHPATALYEPDRRQKYRQRYGTDTIDTHLQKYCYTALKDPSRYIRLLKVTKQHDEHSFEAELTEESLALDNSNITQTSVPRYTALSYTWGQPNDDKALIVDGQRLHIRNNVFDFFLHFWQRYYELFWIDAVCIDQSNIEERGQQVKLMCQIYSQADRVRLWLGCGDNTLCWLLRDMRRIQRDSGSLYSMQMRELQDSYYRSNAQKGYPELGRLAYWTRLWIVQEVFFAKDMKIHYDREEVLWNDLCKAWKVRQNVPLYGIERFDAASPSDLSATAAALDNLIDIKQNIGILTSQPMSLLLQQLHNSNCTLEHDRIYAILSLVEHGDQFPVDYNCSPIELLIEALAFMVRTEAPNHDRIQATQKLADKLLVGLDLDNQSRILVAPRSGLKKTCVTRRTTSSSIHQPWPYRSRHHLLCPNFGEGHGNFTWSTTRSTTLFMPNKSDKATANDMENPFGDNTEYIRCFLRSKTNGRDLVTWNNALGILLILSPALPASSAAESDKPPKVCQKTNSTWILRGRISYDRILRHGTFSRPASKDRGFYELYTGRCGLPGASIDIPVTEDSQDDVKWNTTINLTITDARADIILFGLPEHQGIRLAAMDLMTACGGHSDFVKVEFWSDTVTDSSAFEPRDRDIEVFIPPLDENEADASSYIQYHPHAALYSSGIDKRPAESGNRNTSDGDYHYYIDFLFEEDRMSACGAPVDE